MRSIRYENKVIASVHCSVNVPTHLDDAERVPLGHVEAQVQVSYEQMLHAAKRTVRRQILEMRELRRVRFHEHTREQLRQQAVDEVAIRVRCLYAPMIERV